MCRVTSFKLSEFHNKFVPHFIFAGIIAFQYKNDDTLESILQSAERELDGRKVRYIAFVGHGSPGKLVICHDQVPEFI